jgi:hypothetical protein
MTIGLGALPATGASGDSSAGQGKNKKRKASHEPPESTPARVWKTKDFTMGFMG